MLAAAAKEGPRPSAGKQLLPMQACRRVIYITACHHEALLEPKLLQVHMTFKVDGMDIKRPKV